MSQSRLAAIEAGEFDPAWTDVLALLGLFGADPSSLRAPVRTVGTDSSERPTHRDRLVGDRMVDREV